MNLDRLSASQIEAVLEACGRTEPSSSWVRPDDPTLEQVEEEVLDPLAEMIFGPGAWGLRSGPYQG